MHQLTNKNGVVPVMLHAVQVDSELTQPAHGFAHGLQELLVLQNSPKVHYYRQVSERLILKG